jgi:hypothetical protein
MLCECRYVYTTTTATTTATTTTYIYIYLRDPPIVVFFEVANGHALCSTETRQQQVYVLTVVVRGEGEGREGRGEGGGQGLAMEVTSTRKQEKTKQENGHLPTQNLVPSLFHLTDRAARLIRKMTCIVHPHFGVGEERTTWLRWCVIDRSTTHPHPCRGKGGRKEELGKGAGVREGEGDCEGVGEGHWYQRGNPFIRGSVQGPD